jgi:CubicO group peptidase (beta-lactamase class C family)
MKKLLLIFLLFSFINVNAQSDSTSNYVVYNDSILLPFQRLDTLSIFLASDDSLVEDMLNRYVTLEKNISDANLVIFTSINDFDNSNDLNKKSILINSENRITKKQVDIEIEIKNDISKSKAIQKMFGASTGKGAKGSYRLGFGRAEDVGIDYNKLSTKIDSIANHSIELGVAPGIQVLVARHGVVVFHKTYGYHTYDSIKKVEKNNIYDWASVTKVTSALPALMKLHDEDKFDLDATLGTYLPYFKRGNKKNLTFRRILSHNAGLKSWIPYWKTTLRQNGSYRWRTLSTEKSKHYQTEISPDLYVYNNYKKKIYKMIRKSDVNKEYHPDYKYSGLSFYLQPEIVENISGEDFQDYLNKNFYKKLGANTVGYNPLKRFDIERIIPTENDTIFRHTKLHGTVHDEGAAMMGGVSANAGLFGTTLDLAKIMQMYLWKGKYGDEQYISANTIEKFTCAHYANEGNKRGLGFDKPKLENREDDSCSKDASMKSFGHAGYTGTYVWADPGTGILFVFMSNRVYPTRDNRKLYEYNVRPSMHQAIYDAIIDKELGE